MGKIGATLRSAATIAKEIAGRIYNRIAGRIASAVRTSAVISSIAHTAGTVVEGVEEWAIWDSTTQTGDSTAIERIGYNHFSGELRIVFRDKTPPYPEYIWEDVPRNIAIGLLDSPSKGEYYHRYIKGPQFRSRRY